MKMDKTEIKKKIETYAYYHSGLKNINGGDVRAVNIKVRKDKVIADIIYMDYFDGYHTERYNDCEYPLDLLEKVKV